MQFLNRYSQLFENDTTNTMLTKSHGIIILELSGTKDRSIVWTGTVSLEFTFAKL